MTNTLLDAVTVDASVGRPIADAATREVIGYAPVHTQEQVEAAVAAAHRAQPAWAALGHAERSRILHEIADDIDANRDELAELLSRENGKPLDGANARFEVSAAAIWTRNAADAVLDVEHITAADGTRAEIHYDPLGVVAAVGPWNWPVMISVWQIAPALRTGNAVVAKPSSYTTLSVLALGEIFNRHLPEGVLSVLAADRTATSALTHHPDVRKITFTGSTPTGRRIVKASSSNLARLTLELGGNDAGIVLPGTDVEKIAQDLFWGIFINTGQTCAALKRLYVHESLYGEVVDALAVIAKNTPIGNGLEPGNLLGPLQNKSQFDIVSDLVEDARARGARIVVGGEAAPELGENFYRPTVVADIPDDARLVTEEQFGPVIPVLRYTDLDEVISRANSLDFGLGASVWGADADQNLQVATRLQAGSVWINRHGVLNPNIPFGGSKSSGYGVEFDSHGLKEFVSPKSISL
ncbi:MAG: aldehyde dehydrogenase family protein [Pseudoclavibacter sp.]